jgi:hypothetical protein
VLAGWNSRRPLVLAYAGSDEGAACTAGAVHALRAALPTARLILLWPASALSPARDIDRIDYPAPQRPSSAADCRQTLAQLAQTAAAAAIVFSEQGFAPYPVAYICYLAGIERRAGYAGEFTGGVYTTAIALDSVSSPARRHLRLLEALGLRREVVPLGRFGATTNAPMRDEQRPRAVQ